MDLVKYCQSAHAEAALTKGQLFVGTFARYHRIENDALKDDEEGPARPAIVDQSDEVVISEDDNESLLKHSSVKMANGWQLHMPAGMPLWLDQPAFNTFIYCVSDDPYPSLEKAANLGYDSYFQITDPAGFGRILAQTLATEFQSPFGIRADMGPVNYVPRKINVVNRQNPSRPTKAFSTLDLFTKHERFQEDREVRYVFLEYSNQEKTEFNSLHTDGTIIENPAITQFLAPRLED